MLVMFAVVIVCCSLFTVRCYCLRIVVAVCWCALLSLLVHVCCCVLRTVTVGVVYCCMFFLAGVCVFYVCCCSSCGWCAAVLIVVAGRCDWLALLPLCVLCLLYVGVCCVMLLVAGMRRVLFVAVV